IQEVAPPNQELKQGLPARGGHVQLKHTLSDTAHLAVSDGTNLGWLRQPRFFNYPK
ncbi:unnamed protein product, partial [marine sediment metagenome]